MTLNFHPTSPKPCVYRHKSTPTPLHCTFYQEFGTRVKCTVESFTEHILGTGIWFTAKQWKSPKACKMSEQTYSFTRAISTTHRVNMGILTKLKDIKQYDHFVLCILLWTMKIRVWHSRAVPGVTAEWGIIEAEQKVYESRAERKNAEAPRRAAQWGIAWAKQTNHLLLAPPSNPSFHQDSHILP